MKWRPGFVTIVLLAYAACRLVSAAILVAVGSYQEPTGWTGPEVTYLSFTQQWDAQWYRQVMDTGYPSTLPADARSRSRRRWSCRWRGGARRA